VSEPAPGISSEQLDYLLRRYTPAEGQACVVCGAPLAFSSSNVPRGFLGRYNCSSEAATRPCDGVTLRERVAHYERSAWYDHGQADLAVVALVKSYRELEPRAACPCFDEPAEARLREDAAAFERETARLDTEGFTARTLDALGLAGNAGGEDDLG
jgi:hypothetical protein